LRILVDTGVFSASICRRQLRHACRQAGHALHEPVHSSDLWIAASAIHIDAPLLTADTDFNDVPGLSLLR